jgi:DMSO reductase anchor subunit
VNNKRKIIINLKLTKIKMEAKRNSMLMIVMILCTVTIISTNYMFNKQTVIDVNNTLTENEYKKI